MRCQTSEVRGQEPEIRDQRSDIRGQEARVDRTMNSASETSFLRVCLKLTCRAIAAKAEDLKLKTAVSLALPPSNWALGASSACPPWWAKAFGCWMFAPLSC